MFKYHMHLNSYPLHKVLCPIYLYPATCYNGGQWADYDPMYTLSNIWNPQP